MAAYEHGRVKKLANSLAAHGVDPAASAQILEGGEAITKATPAAAKIDWLRAAMEKMDRLMEPTARHAVREDCACCVGGKRLQITRDIARQNATLETRITACNEAPYVFGHSVTREADGSVTVRFFPEGQAPYRCPCLPQAKEAMPITYCYCCGGHVKGHLQRALGRKMAVTVVETALTTVGQRPCTFSLAFADAG